MDVRMRTAATLLVVWGLVVQQSAHTQQQPQRPPVFRGESVLVTVDVYPQRDGVIVDGLKARDFQVLEDGKPQTVESVEFVRVEPSLSESTRRDPNSIGEMLREAADSHNRVFVVFLDQLHVGLDGSYWSRRPMVDALNRIIAANDLFAMMTQNTDPRALTFGRRLISVEEQLTRYWTWGERNRISLDPTDPMEAKLKSCYGEPSSPDLADMLIERRREDRTLAALERLVGYLRGMREARTVVLTVTEGWRLFTPSDELRTQAGAHAPQLPPVGIVGGRITMGGGQNVFAYECQTELVRLAMLDDDRRFKELLTDANRANVSFYPVHPVGLQALDTPISEKNPPSLSEDADRLRRRVESMRVLAENTDGIAVVGANDLAVGPKRIIDDVSAYYLLGYYSTNTSHDGRYRRIEVKTKSQGVHTRARRGYLAPSNKPVREVSAPPAAARLPAGLDDALGELGRIRVSADAYVRGSLAGDRALVAVELSTRRAGSAPWTTGADVQVVVTPNSAPSLAPAKARLDAGTRGTLLSVPLGATAAATARVVATISAGGETVEETAQIKRTPSTAVGDALVYRGRPAATSPLRAVADLQFRRTERVHVEWLVGAELDQRSARLLARSGQPLAIPDGGTGVWCVLVLHPEPIGL